MNPQYELKLHQARLMIAALRWAIKKAQADTDHTRHNDRLRQFTQTCQEAVGRLM